MEDEAPSLQPTLFPGVSTIKMRGITVKDVEHMLTAQTVEELSAIDGIGPVVAESLVEWMGHKEHRELLHKFSKGGVVCLIPEKSSVKQIFTGKTFVLTGTLPTLSREEARELIKLRGGSVSSSVSKKTDYVLAGEDPGSKYEDAVKLNIAIIDEGGFREMLG
jgi:DNA ligase (NAD+)